MWHLLDVACGEWSFPPISCHTQLTRQQTLDGCSCIKNPARTFVGRESGLPYSFSCVLFHVWRVAAHQNHRFSSMHPPIVAVRLPCHWLPYNRSLQISQQRHKAEHQPCCYQHTMWHSQSFLRMCIEACRCERRIKLAWFSNLPLTIRPGPDNSHNCKNDLAMGGQGAGPLGAFLSVSPHHLMHADHVRQSR